MVIMTSSQSGGNKGMSVSPSAKLSAPRLPTKPILSFIRANPRNLDRCPQSIGYRMPQAMRRQAFFVAAATQSLGKTAPASLGNPSAEAVLHMLRNQSVNADEKPDVIGLRLLAHVMSDPELAARFLALSGLDADTLRARAGDPGLLAALIEFIAGHEPDLVAAADALALTPMAIVAAGAALGGGTARRGTTP
jgi:hypothetical protein